MHLITLFQIVNPHQRCLQAKVKYRNEPKTGNAVATFGFSGSSVFTFDCFRSDRLSPDDVLSKDACPSCPIPAVVPIVDESLGSSVFTFDCFHSDRLSPDDVLSNDACPSCPLPAEVSV